MSLLNQQTHDLIHIWKEAVCAVNGEQLTKNCVEYHRSASRLSICGNNFSLEERTRIFIVGAGKASGHMAIGLVEGIRNQLGDHPSMLDRISGWVNIPEDVSIPENKAGNSRITFHQARPAGSNFPALKGVNGTKEIIRMISSTTQDDIVIFLISGGGSALLPLPVDEISLEEKIWITKHLSQHGADIEQLNKVRICLSKVKGGKLLNYLNTPKALTLIISDIIGDPVDLIASGPTYKPSVSISSITQEALDILNIYSTDSPSYHSIVNFLKQTLTSQHEKSTLENPLVSSIPNCIIGSNQAARNHATNTGRKLGYHVDELVSSPYSGDAVTHAKEVAKRLREFQFMQARNPTSGETLFIAGGETTVKLSNTTKPGKGGRNQEVALAVLCEFFESGLKGIQFLSAGTDGEDGPTDAAGAFINHEVWQKAKLLELNPYEYLAHHDAYNFFAKTDSLFITGPTQTNVMDLELGIVNCPVQIPGKLLKT